ncbi:MAG: hypothetical protein NTZ93_05120 [Candidatus Beckwithbacteria bacterium]|nr:hypothetical protein [Candidatus Beckwithbacteria bacterium]
MGTSFSLREEFLGKAQKDFSQNKFGAAYIQALASRILSAEAAGLVK